MPTAYKSESCRRSDTFAAGMERELTLEELKLLRRVARRADDLLEEALKHRENLEQTFTRVFPAMIRELGAIAMAVTTLDEELTTSTFAHGDFGATPLSAEKGWGVRLLANGNTLVSQELDLVGTPVGALGVIFKGDRLKDALILSLLVDTLSEELDTVLAAR